MRKQTGDGLVYSSEFGRMCPGCGQPVANCICRQQNQSATGSGAVRVGRETQGRKGKGVTVITGLPLNPDDLKILAKRNQTGVRQRRDSQKRNR